MSAQSDLQDATRRAGAARLEEAASHERKSAMRYRRENAAESVWQPYIQMAQQYEDCAKILRAGIVNPAG